VPSIMTPSYVLTAGIAVGYVLAVVIQTARTTTPTPTAGPATHRQVGDLELLRRNVVEGEVKPKKSPPELKEPAKSSQPSALDGVRILIAIAAYDMSQFVHLEEVLDAYLDMCVAGSMVEVVIHATQPWSVALIDLLNTRLTCHNPSPNAGFTVTVSLRSPSIRLNLANLHRSLFYDRLEDYDIFIYTEDDIRVTPKTVAAYIYETSRVQELLGGNLTKASKFNVGIVRYEYNFPPDVVITDKTRHVTRNTTRVYWEHREKRGNPPFDFVPQPELGEQYVHMQNYHSGMFIATRELLKAWRDKPGCEFDTITLRPNNIGTQRVWMSAKMLHMARYCNVQQVIPVDNFGQLNVLHLPNKNYRRVGQKGRIGGGKVTKLDRANMRKEKEAPSAQIEGADSSLLTALNMHLQIREKLLWTNNSFGRSRRKNYTGIQMVDDRAVAVKWRKAEMEGKKKNSRYAAWNSFIEERAGDYNSQTVDIDTTPALNMEYKAKVEVRLKAFHAYANRGGIMLKSDMVSPEVQV